MALVEMIQQKSFLGTEFATWLWFRSEKADGKFEFGKDETCEIGFERDIVLTSEYGEAIASALKGEAPTLSPEAGAALVAGKKIKRARLTLTTGDVQWAFTLNAENFDWTGLKIETPPSMPFFEAVPLRLHALEEFHRVFVALYDRFLEVRLDADAWESEVKEMRKWVAQKANPEDRSEA